GTEKVLQASGRVGRFRNPVGCELDPLGAPRVGDVAEAPHASDALAADALRLGQALIDAPVLERKDVEARRLGPGVELADLAQEFLRVRELLQNEGDGFRSEEHTSELQSR